MSKLIARVLTRLPGYEEPDTKSQREGFIDPGPYVVDRYLENHPDDDTDYALVKAPALGAGDTWICTRWTDQRYANVETESEVRTERRTFDADPMGIPEQALVDALPPFHDFNYDLDEARYPFRLPGANVPQAPPRSNNCCTFVEGLVVKAWADVHDGFTWSSARHGQMMILSSDDFYSPVTAMIDAGMGVAVADPDAPPHPWTLIQGWRLQWRNGHTFLIVDHHEETDRVLTLESNSAYKLNGVGFRAIGNLRDVGGRPPESWWERDDLWTWETIRSTYRFRRQTWLKVQERSWSGL